MSLPTDFLGRIGYILQNYGGSLLRGAGTTLLIAVVSTFIGCLITHYSNNLRIQVASSEQKRRIRLGRNEGDDQIRSARVRHSKHSR